MQLLHLAACDGSTDMAADAYARGAPHPVLLNSVSISAILPLHSYTQKDIGCWDLLSASAVPGGRARFCVRSLSDNFPAGSAINRLMFRANAEP